MAIKCITVWDDDYKNILRGNSAKLPDRHATLTKDIAKIIMALQSTPTAKESNVVGDGESKNGHAECNLMEATISSTHQIEPNNRTLTNITILGALPPQKLKAVCGLIAAPGSTVKSLTLIGLSEDGRVFEEMLSAQKKGGSYPALETLTFHQHHVWSGTLVDGLGKFLKRTPSIKELVFSYSKTLEEYRWRGKGMEGLKRTIMKGRLSNRSVESCVAVKLAEALCLNNQVHSLQFKQPVALESNYIGPYKELQEAVLSVLIHDSQGQHPITALNCLHLQCTNASNGSLLCEFIKTTKCLTDLRITDPGGAPESRA